MQADCVLFSLPVLLGLFRGANHARYNRRCLCFFSIDCSIHGFFIQAEKDWNNRDQRIQFIII